MSFVNQALLKQAHGEDIITPGEKAALQEASLVRTWRLRWFNTENGWRLRRLVRGHALKRNDKSEHCALCAGKRKGVERKKTNAYCEDCNVPLCPIPPKEGYEHSCHHDWHHMDILEPRIIYKAGSSSSAGKEKTRNDNDDDDDYEEEVEHDEEEEEAMEENEDENENEPAKAKVARVVYEWSHQRDLFDMLQNLGEVLPAGTPWYVNRTQNTPQRIKAVVNRARLIFHPDKQDENSSETRLEMSTQVTAAINAAYDEYKQENEGD